MCQPVCPSQPDGSLNVRAPVAASVPAPEGRGAAHSPSCQRTCHCSSRRTGPHSQCAAGCARARRAGWGLHTASCMGGGHPSRAPGTAAGTRLPQVNRQPAGQSESPQLRARAGRRVRPPVPPQWSRRRRHDGTSLVRPTSTHPEQADRRCTVQEQNCSARHAGLLGCCAAGL